MKISHLHNMRGNNTVFVIKARQFTGLANRANAHLGHNYDGPQVSAANNSDVRDGEGTPSNVCSAKLALSTKPLQFVRQR